MSISSPFEGIDVLAGNIYKGNLVAAVGYDDQKDYYTAEVIFILFKTFDRL